MLTKEQIEKALPATLKSSASQALTDHINNVVSDPILAEQVRDNFISYTSVLKDGRYKIDDYLNAVMYVSYKLMGTTNLDAYCKTFPQRYQKLAVNGTSQKDIAAYVHAYNKGKLVQAIMEQTLTPVWVLNQDIYQKAINVQAELMVGAQSEKVRSDAANSILTHLGKPKEAANNTLNLNIENNSGMDELKDLLTKLATTQSDLIKNGVSAKEIAGQPLIEGTVIPRGTN